MSSALYMQRALELAALGLGRVSPNPMVGCVIVHGDSIIGEGYHRQYGGAHAEVRAVESVRDKSLLKDATFYITLEPCSYQGKTPACTNLLLRHRPQKVVVATPDPNPRVSGRGLAILAEAGIATEQGLLAAEARALNKRFWVNMHGQRPYVILKWAQTADGFLARKDYSSKWISHARARQLVHAWRTAEDAILVGYNTALHDDPQLTARHWPGRNPVRVVLDPEDALPADRQLLQPPGPTHVFTTRRKGQEGPIQWHCLAEKEYLPAVLETLYRQEVGSVLVEGGARTLQQFLTAGLWDEARVFTALSVRFGEGLRAPVLPVPPRYSKYLDDNLLTISYNPDSEKLWQKN